MIKNILSKLRAPVSNIKKRIKGEDKGVNLFIIVKVRKVACNEENVHSLGTYLGHKREAEEVLQKISKNSTDI